MASSAPVGATSGIAPAHQPIQRRQRPGGHDVEAIASVQLLGPAADHPHTR